MSVAQPRENSYFYVSFQFSLMSVSHRQNFFIFSVSVLWVLDFALFTQLFKNKLKIASFVAYDVLHQCYIEIEIFIF